MPSSALLIAAFHENSRRKMASLHAILAAASKRRSARTARARRFNDDYLDAEAAAKWGSYAHRVIMR